LPGLADPAAAPLAAERLSDRLAAALRPQPLLRAQA